MDKPSAMRLPAVTFQIGHSGFGFTTDLCRHFAFEQSVDSTVIVIFSKRFKLSLQINRVPELHVGGEFLFTRVQEFFRGQKGLCQFCANLNYQ
jgi:hypothetical protein